MQSGMRSAEIWMPSTENARWNLNRTELVEQAIINQEGRLAPSGALLVKTGEYTGRAPNDKFIVDYGLTSDQKIHWGDTNKPISPKNFEKLYRKVTNHLSGVPVYVEEVLIGANINHQRKIRIISEFAWAALFTRDLFIPSPTPFLDDPDFTLLHAPLVSANPVADGTTSPAFVLINFQKHIILIGHTRYGGEIKKSVFSIMNRILPEENVLPMHCSANVGKNGDCALFFGLSGTGKTTLSSDPNRFLIGDDEHGWGDEGVFNFEGGCYAKMIRLKQDLEPIIWDASQQFGSVLENVVYDEKTRRIDFEDNSITENTRAAYPLKNVTNCILSGTGSHPKNIFFLCADAFGVLPPIASLSPEQAAYYFILGYTSKLAGTELGVGCKPKATFSACFGEPFLPLNPVVYMNMLRDRVKLHGSKVWLINTGWTGGVYDIGSRIKLANTRAMISAVLEGKLDPSSFHSDPVFGLKIPKTVDGVPSTLLNPILSWADLGEYHQTAELLLTQFQANATKFKISKI